MVKVFNHQADQHTFCHCKCWYLCQWYGYGCVSNPLGPLTIVNEKYEPMTYADLGSAVIANFGMTSYVDNVNLTEKKYGEYSLTDPNYANYTQNRKERIYFTFQLLSSLFTGSADKYIPMSAINGFSRSEWFKSWK